MDEHKNFKKPWYSRCIIKRLPKCEEYSFQWRHLKMYCQLMCLPLQTGSKNHSPGPGILRSMYPQCSGPRVRNIYIYIYIYIYVCVCIYTTPRISQNPAQAPPRHSQGTHPVHKQHPGSLLWASETQKPPFRTNPREGSGVPSTSGRPPWAALGSLRGTPTPPRKHRGNLKNVKKPCVFPLFLTLDLAAAPVEARKEA